MKKKDASVAPHPKLDTQTLRDTTDFIGCVDAANEFQDEGNIGDIAHHLQELHRELSEEIVACNRGLARLAVTDKEDEKVVLRAQVLKLNANRAKIQIDLERTLKTLKDCQHNDNKQEKILPPSVENEAPPIEKGLIRQRHPNRDFFLADLFDYALKDDGASMEAPIFTLATKPDLSIWRWTSKDGNKSIKVTPSVLGRATQFDKDVLIYVVSQLTEALNRGREDAQSRTVRFTVYDYLVTTNRGVSGDDYRRLQEAFERLQGTSIMTDIKTGGERIKESFGVIDSWRTVQKSHEDERMIAVEITLSKWLFNAVQAFEVLTIHPDYFRLRKPLARRIYEISRKHCGHQKSWAIGLDLLRDKSGSKSTIREFRRTLRTIEADDSLPEYRLVLEQDDKVTVYLRSNSRLVKKSV